RRAVRLLQRRRRRRQPAGIAGRAWWHPPGAVVVPRVRLLVLRVPHERRVAPTGTATRRGNAMTGRRPGSGVRRSCRGRRVLAPEPAVPIDREPWRTRGGKGHA